jgi:hypothetical protein
MSEFTSRLEKCERAVEQLRAELDALQNVMHRHHDEIITAVLSQMDMVFAGIEGANRKIFADLRAQTDAGFARLQMLIETMPETNNDDELPKLN